MTDKRTCLLTCIKLGKNYSRDLFLAKNTCSFLTGKTLSLLYFCGSIAPYRVLHTDMARGQAEAVGNNMHMHVHTINSSGSRRSIPFTCVKRIPALSI